MRSSCDFDSSERKATVFLLSSDHFFRVAVLMSWQRLHCCCAPSTFAPSVWSAFFASSASLMASSDDSASSSPETTPQAIARGATTSEKIERARSGLERMMPKGVHRVCQGREMWSHVGNVRLRGDLRVVQP